MEAYPTPPQGWGWSTSLSMTDMRADEETSLEFSLKNKQKKGNMAYISLYYWNKASGANSSDNTWSINQKLLKSWAVWQVGEWHLSTEEDDASFYLTDMPWKVQKTTWLYGTVTLTFMTVHPESVLDTKPGSNLPSWTTRFLCPWTPEHRGCLVSSWGRNQTNER